MEKHSMPSSSSEKNFLGFRQGVLTLGFKQSHSSFGVLEQRV